MHAFARLLRRAAAPLLAALLCLPAAAALAETPAPIPALDAPVVDTTGTLSAADVARLQAQALDLQTRKGSQLQILIVPTTAPESIEQYAQRVFDQWKLGRKGVDDGVLLLVAKDDHQARIQTGYGLEGAIPDITAGRVIQEYLVPKFRAGDFAGGLDDATAQLVRLIDGESLPAPMAPSASDGPAGPDALFLPVILLFFFRGLFGWLPTPVRMALFAGGAGLVAWILTHAVPWTGLAALFGLVIGALGASTGRYARDSGWGGWGGGGSSGGGWSGGGGGGWSGGGGSSGGGGASGSW